MNIPTKCPSCEYKLIEINMQLFCKNPQCEAQSSKKVQAFIKKMKIKGLGEKNIEKLGIESVPEIYVLERNYLIDTLGVVGGKIFNEIQKSRVVTFRSFMAALSIPLIGSSAAEKIARYCNQLEDLTQENLVKANIGEKARANIATWLESNFEDFSYLPITFTERVVVEDLPCRGTICITGKLDNFANRSEAKAALEELGYRVINVVNMTLDYLVNEQDRASSKLTKAKSLNIPITTMQHLISVAGE